MKNVFFITLFFCFISCVQKSYKRRVVFQLDVSKVKNIQSVGVRGEAKPLSWEQDLPMKELVKDSLYEITATTETGYEFFEAKFTVNGKFELENEPNREIIFTGDTTVYKATFNKR